MPILTGRPTGNGYCFNPMFPDAGIFIEWMKTGVTWYRQPPADDCRGNIPADGNQIFFNKT